MKRRVRPAVWSSPLAGCVLALGVLSGCVVDDQIGVRSKERIPAGVVPLDDAAYEATYDEVTDTYRIEGKLDLSGPKTETEELIDSMRARDR